MNLKKIIIFIIFLIILSLNVLSISVTYFSQSGSDTTGNGNLTNPYKTITKLNTITLRAGDIVYFNCSDTWNSVTDAHISFISGNSSGNVTYDGSWGNCNSSLWGVNSHPRARILQSYNASNPNNWSLYIGNIWRTNFTSPYDIGNIIFNVTNEFYSGFGSGYKYDNFTLLNSSGEQRAFFYNKTDDYIYVYSSANPATLYSDIQLARRKSSSDSDMFDIGNKDYIVIKNFDLRYLGQGGIAAAPSASLHTNLYILNNTVSWVGGIYQSGILRMGNGIGSSLRNYNLNFENNIVYQVYDACYSSQSWLTAGAQNMTGVHYLNNIGTHCEYGFEFFNSADGGVTNDWDIKGNTFAFIGNEWSVNQRSDGNTRWIMTLKRTPALTSDFNISNNIFYSSGNRPLVLGQFTTTSWKGETPYMDNNLYNKTPYTGNLVSWNNSDYSTLASFVSAIGKETNGYEGNPLFVSTDVTNSSFLTPAYNSPACNMSSTGSYVGALPCASAPLINTVFVFNITGNTFLYLRNMVLNLT